MQLKASKFDNLQKLEQQQQDTAYILSDKAEDKRLVRSGKRKQWTSYFTNSEVDEFCRIHEPMLKKFKYIE